MYGQIITYPPVVLLKFKLPACDLKSHYISTVPLDCFLSYLILYFYVFCVFGEEKHKSGVKLHI